MEVKQSGKAVVKYRPYVLVNILDLCQNWQKIFSELTDPHTETSD